MVKLIVAVAQNGVIGAAGKIPWHLPEDLKRFKQLTMGHVLVMGRKTYESIGKPLPGRDTIVLTRSRWISGNTASATFTTATSLREVLTWSDRKSPTRYASRDVFICGGAEVYRAALEADVVDELLLTQIAADYEGDVRMPDIDYSKWSRGMTTRQVTSGSSTASLSTNSEFKHMWTYESWARKRT